MLIGAIRVGVADSVRQLTNVTNALEFAYEDMSASASEPVSEAPVDLDWFNVWRGAAGAVTNVDLQQLWGRVLSAETRVPGSFSLRTLAFLSTMSSHEAYAKALLAATRQADLVKSDQPKKVAGLTPEQMAKMEREMSALQQDYKSIEASYGDDILHLVIATGYLSRLLQNRHIDRYLGQNHSELLQDTQRQLAMALEMS